MQAPNTVAGVNIYGEADSVEVQRMKWRPSAYALLFNEAGEILVLDNRINGKLDLVGGGIEIWETAEEALIREAMEETGLTIHIDKFVYLSEQFFHTPSNNHWHVMSLFYRATVLSGTLQSTLIQDEPSVNPHWLDPKHLRKENFTIAGAGLAFEKTMGY